MQNAGSQVTSLLADAAFESRVLDGSI